VVTAILNDLLIRFFREPQRTQRTQREEEEGGIEELFLILIL
jgi:hypothetical protein